MAFNGLLPGPTYTPGPTAPSYPLLPHASYGLTSLHASHDSSMARTLLPGQPMTSSLASLVPLKTEMPYTSVFDTYRPHLSEVYIKDIIDIH